MSRFIICYNHAFLTRSNMCGGVLFISKVHLNLFFCCSVLSDDEALNEKINENGALVVIEKSAIEKFILGIGNVFLY